MLTKYMLKMPKVVYGGEEAIVHIRDIVGNGVRKVAVFSDKGITGSGLLEPLISTLKEMGLEFTILDDLPAEPTCDQAQQVVDAFKKTGADFIVAAGGGSVMDIAKLASVLVTDEYTVRDLLENPGLARKCVQTLMIPTTAGTGAEATPNSIVAIPEKELKVGIVNENMIADYVILDAAMIKNLPRKIAASTGIDALAHAIECYTSKKANPFSDLFALEALDLIINNIEEACDNPDANAAKEAMLTGAFYAGVAITASGTTAVHALSYPLGGKYHIPHGVANAMLLTPVMRFNEPFCKKRLSAVYDRVTEGNGHLPHEISFDKKSSWVIRRLVEIVKHLDIPDSLNAFGVVEDDLEELVRAGMSVQRLLVNNMREVTPQDARSLYQEIL